MNSVSSKIPVAFFFFACLRNVGRRRVRMRPVNIKLKSPTKLKHQQGSQTSKRCNFNILLCEPAFTVAEEQTQTLANLFECGLRSAHSFLINAFKRLGLRVRFPLCFKYDVLYAIIPKHHQRRFQL